MTRLTAVNCTTEGMTVRLGDVNLGFWDYSMWFLRYEQTVPQELNWYESVMLLDCALEAHTEPPVRDKHRAEKVWLSMYGANKRIDNKRNKPCKFRRNYLPKVDKYDHLVDHDSVMEQLMTDQQEV